MIAAISIAGIALTALSCAEKQTENASMTKSPFSDYSITTLDNGLDVIVKEVHTAPIVAVYLWCNTGSINETEPEHGISHFYEHMFFKGTEKRGVGEIDRAIKSLGGYNNAFTSKEYTAYYVVLPSDNFNLAADVLVDAIRNSSFPEEEIKKELGVIKEEINRKEDQPIGKLYEELFKVVFKSTPYEHPVLGTKESVSAMTRDDFRRYLDTFYVPNNMSAVVVGDVTTEDAVAEIKRLTEGWEPNQEVDSKRAEFSNPESSGVQDFVIEKDVNMTYVMMAFKTDGYTDFAENASLDVMSSVLGEGRSSRLYRRLVEEDRLVSSVQAFIYPMRHTGLFMVYATLDAENVDAFRDAILEEMDKLRNEPLSSEELKKVQTMLKADYQFSNETDSDIAHTLGFYNTLGMLDRITEYEHSIESVTVADVQKYAQAVLNPSSYTFGVIQPRTDAGDGGGR